MAKDTAGAGRTAGEASCPACGAKVGFRSAASVQAICAYCGALLIRRGEDLEAIGRVAKLLEDPTSIQVGTRGNWGGTPFTVLGRVRMKWLDGFWNEWHLALADGRTAWMGEAQGTYALSVEVSVGDRIPSLSAVLPGLGVRLGDETYRVTDRREALVEAGEGELPLAFGIGETVTSVDLVGPGRAFAGLTFEQDSVCAFVGEWAEFDSLQLSNLRDAAAVAAVLADRFECPTCGGQIQLRAKSLSLTVACAHCGTVVDASDPKHAVVSRAHEVARLNPLLPLGSIGTFDGVRWEVIGFLLRTDSSGFHEWREWLLFDARRGFRWLAESDGHWTYYEPLREWPSTLQETTVRFRREEYRRFVSGAAKVKAVLGEFPWRVKVGETVSVSDYVAPPHMLSCEGSEWERAWSLGSYRRGAEVLGAFGLGTRPPAAKGIAPHQPSPWREARGSVLATAGIAALFAFVVFVAGAILSTGRTVAERDVRVTTDEVSREIVIPDLALEDGVANLEISASAVVANSWIWLDYELTELSKGRTRSFGRGIEYYAGRDSEGAWSEGSTRDRIVLTEVPAGTYALTVRPQPAPGARDLPLRVAVRRDVATPSNFLVAMLLLGLPAMFVVWRAFVFEVARWAESDDSPYESDDEEDE